MIAIQKKVIDTCQSSSPVFSFSTSVVPPPATGSGGTVSHNITFYDTRLRRYSPIEGFRANTIRRLNKVTKHMHTSLTVFLMQCSQTASIMLQKLHTSNKF